jgi:hypothetical protein
MRTYEAALSRAENIAQVRAAIRAIERVGGRVSIGPPAPTGVVVVEITLPEPYTPDAFVPGLPFYPV